MNKNKMEDLKKVGVSKKTQPKPKKWMSFQKMTTYLINNQYVMLVAFWLRFGCVSMLFCATVAHFLVSGQKERNQNGWLRGERNQKNRYNVLIYSSLCNAEMFGCAVAPKKYPICFGK